MSASRLNGFGALLALLVGLAWPAQAQIVVRYVHTDALGSVVALTDQSRTVVERREYEPYGTQLTPTVQDGPGYTGHVQDAATGLTYMQQRYYDPIVGRFLSVDPVTANSSTGANFNRYWYANNNPYKFIDPDGRLGCTGTHIKSVCDSGGIAGLQTSARSPMDSSNFVRPSSGGGFRSEQRESGKPWTNPTGGKVRGCDDYGCGNDGASRGRRTHLGADYESTPGQDVISPTDGKVQRLSMPYKDDSRYSGVRMLTTDGKVVNIWYLKPDKGVVGSGVSAGQRLGAAQDLQVKYGPAMTNHNHVKVTSASGQNIDPTTLIPDP